MSWSGTSSRRMEPSQHLLAALEIPSPVQMPYAIQWQRPLSLLSIHLPLLRVGEASMYPSANAFLSKALVKFKSQDHARGQGPPWGAYGFHYLWWLMSFITVFFRKTGYLWVLVTGVSTAVIRAPSHLFGAPLGRVGAMYAQANHGALLWPLSL